MAENNRSNISNEKPLKFCSLMHFTLSERNFGHEFHVREISIVTGDLKQTNIKKRGK